MKFQNLSVKRLFGRVAIGLVLSMSGITIALFLVTKQIAVLLTGGAVLLTGGALLLCAIVGIFVLTQAFGKRLSQFTTCLLYTSFEGVSGVGISYYISPRSALLFRNIQHFGSC